MHLLQRARCNASQPLHLVWKGQFSCTEEYVLITHHGVSGHRVDKNVKVQLLIQQFLQERNGYILPVVISEFELPVSTK